MKKFYTEPSFEQLKIEREDVIMASDTPAKTLGYWDILED